MGAEGMDVSVLSRGIDAAALNGGLSGGTVCVIAGGLGIVYQSENTEPHERRFADGPMMSSSRWASSRNRVMSGLSLVVVIVESVQESHSPITASIANDQGREVMAVPIGPLDRRPQGCNLLDQRQGNVRSVGGRRPKVDPPERTAHALAR